MRIHTPGPLVTTKISPARQLIDLVWQHNREATGHSWQRLNHSMADALRLAITAGLRFDLHDFAAIYKDMRGGYWFGEPEHSFYRLAVDFDHLSACQSFEAWKERPPFIHAGRRLAVGQQVTSWIAPGLSNQMPRAVVTSFAADGQSLTACTYKPGTSQAKIAKRYRITIEALRARERDLEK